MLTLYRKHPLGALGGKSEYFFWPGKGKSKAAASNWQRVLKRLGTRRWGAKSSKINSHWIDPRQRALDMAVRATCG
jgi:hypothetical protein